MLTSCVNLPGHEEQGGAEGGEKGWTKSLLPDVLLLFCVQL